MRTRICAHRARGYRRRGKRKQPFSRHRKCGILSPSWGFACYTTASLNNMSGESPVRYSIVVPFFNEQENIPALYMRLTEVMDGLGEPYEIVFVDDGSRDESYKVLEDIFEHDRREIIQEIQLYGELHRFIPALAGSTGANITEVPIENYHRKSGKSNYGIGRTIRVFLDLVIVKFLLDYSTRPLQFFGLLGLAGSGAGILVGLFLAFTKLYYHTAVMNEHGPLMLLAIALFVSGIQFISMGLLGEMLARTYYESQNKPIYALREVKSHRKELGDSAESARSPGPSER